MSKTLGTEITYYNYDENNNIVVETNQSGNILVSYVYNDKNLLLTITKHRKTYTLYANARGDITKVTDEVGDIIANFEYDTWGNTKGGKQRIKDQKEQKAHKERNKSKKNNVR